MNNFLISFPRNGEIKTYFVMVFCLLICSGEKYESVTFLFFTCDLTFFLGEKATKACFLSRGRRPRLRKLPRLPFPPEKKSNHTRKTKKVTR